MIDPANAVGSSGSVGLQLSAGLFFGAGAILAYGARSPIRGLLEIVVLSTLLGAWVGTAGSVAWSTAGKGVLTVAAAWSLGWAGMAPLRALGREAAARLLGLLIFGFLFAVPWLAGRSGVRAEGLIVQGAVPDWVLLLSPLARIHGSVLGEDWLHGPGLYLRLGESYYQYPDATDGLAAVAVLVLLAFALSLGLLRPRTDAKRRGREVGETLDPPPSRESPGA